MPRMSSTAVAPRRASARRASWHEPGDAFIARRLREIVAPGQRAGAVAVAPDGEASVAIVATSRGIARIDLFEGSQAALPEGVRDEPALNDVAELLARCFASWQPAAAQLPLDVTGTAFQLEVWAALRGIGAGRTASYGEVARRIGRKPGASRAIGQAVGANPVPVVVPCHRVLAAGGAIGGFACGLPMKRRLLSAEGVQA